MNLTEGRAWVAAQEKRARDEFQFRPLDRLVGMERGDILAEYDELRHYCINLSDAGEALLTLLDSNDIFERYPGVSEASDALEKLL